MDLSGDWCLRSAQRRRLAQGATQRGRRVARSLTNDLRHATPRLCEPVQFADFHGQSPPVQTTRQQPHRRAHTLRSSSPLRLSHAGRLVRFWWGVEVGGADDPTADARWILVGGDELDGFSLMDRAGPDDPTVQCEFAAELLPDAAEHLDVALAGVGVDGRDHAAPAQRVDADEHVTDGQGAAGPRRFGVGGHPGDEQVGAEPADVVAPRGRRRRWRRGG